MALERDRLYALSERMVQPTMAFIDLKRILVSENEDNSVFLDI